MFSGNKLLIVSIATVLVVGLAIGIVLVQRSTSVAPEARDDDNRPALSCPDGTEWLFTSTGKLKVNTSDRINFDGKLTSLTGDARIENEGGILLANQGRKFIIEFPKEMLLHTAIYRDNDPKKGEEGWSINGVKLPTTGQGKWADPYFLNIISNKIEFDHGDDSPHITICLKPEPDPTPTPTVTNTPTPTLTPVPSDVPTPTPTATPEVTPTPTLTITPTPTIYCPLPEPPNVEIICESCTQF